MFKKLAGYGFDGFLFAIIGMIVLARLFPYFGSADSPVPLAEIANYAVSLIFFFYGLKLSPEKLKAGLSNWKLHLAVHTTTFIIFPVLVLFTHAAMPFMFTEDTWLGIFYLAALPSTVSSSVVMVSIARGNMPAAIFNASISALLGVFITPIWMQFWMAGNDVHMAALNSIIIKLLLQVLLPVALGLLLHKRFGHFAEKYRTQLKQFDQSIILLIIYTAFCESFTEHVFDGLSLPHLLILFAAVLILFFLVMGITQLTSKLLSFNREDTITYLFCGSKKSLVHGTVIANVLFAGIPGLGLILLPLMLYHALQLLIASFIANRYARAAIS